MPRTAASTTWRVPAAPVALVLGAQVYADGTPSPFLAARLDYDSCHRARQVFGVDRAIVVTQSFHVARAVAVCRGVGLDAVGVGDDSVRRFRRAWLRGWGREQLAAVKAIYDVASRRDPVFLGPRETGIDGAVRN